MQGFLQSSQAGNPGGFAGPGIDCRRAGETHWIEPGKRFTALVLDESERRCRGKTRWEARLLQASQQETHKSL